MNTAGTEYGTFSKVGNKYNVWGSNPLSSKQEYIGVALTPQEAQSFLNKYNFDFFSKHSNLLPRCISLNRRDQKFSFTLPLKGKSVFVGYYHSLDEAVQAKINFITKLI